MFALFVAVSAVAQPGWEWGDQVDVAKEKNALYTDMLKAGKYSEALDPLTWLLENAPKLNKSLYQNGAKVFQGLAEKETDATKKAEYAEKHLEMFDKRIEYFGQEAFVLNRKVYPAYKYYKDKKGKYATLLEMYDRAFELNGNDFYDNNLVAYMDVVRRYKLTGGEIDDQRILDVYFGIKDVIDEKKKSADSKKAARLERNSDTIDKMLLGTVDVNCEFVENNLGPKLEETGEVKLAKQIFGLLLSNKCTDSPLAVKAAEIVNENQPDYGIAKFIAGKAAKEGDVSKAFDYFNKAADLTDDNLEKAEIHLSIARLHIRQNDKASARRSARKALAFDPSAKNAYKLIGDLYMTSFEDCKGGVKKVDDRAVFLAAYKMYQRAGDSKSMANAKAQFPSIEDIFNEEYAEGQTLQVGCWINESVTIERRPN